MHIFISVKPQLNRVWTTVLKQDLSFRSCSELSGSCSDNWCRDRNVVTSIVIYPYKRWKPAWFGYVTCHNSFSRTVLQGTMKGGWCHGWQKECWMDNIKVWTSLPMPELLIRASCRKEGLGWIAPHVPATTLSVKGLNWTGAAAIVVRDLKDIWMKGREIERKKYWFFRLTAFCFIGPGQYLRAKQRVITSVAETLIFVSKGLITETGTREKGYRFVFSNKKPLLFIWFH